MSFRRKVRSSYCPFDKMSVRLSVRRQNVRRQNVRSAKCLSAKCLSAKCLSAKCPGTMVYRTLQIKTQYIYLASKQYICGCELECPEKHLIYYILPDKTRIWPGMARKAFYIPYPRFIVLDKTRIWLEMARKAFYIRWITQIWLRMVFYPRFILLYHIRAYPKG